MISLYFYYFTSYILVSSIANTLRTTTAVDPTLAHSKPTATHPTSSAVIEHLLHSERNIKFIKSLFNQLDIDPNSGMTDHKCVFKRRTCRYELRKLKHSNPKFIHWSSSRLIPTYHNNFTEWTTSFDAFTASKLTTCSNSQPNPST